MSDTRNFAVRQPLGLTVSAPERFLHADVIEIRVSLTPLRWDEAQQQYEQSDDKLYSQVQFVRVEAKESRMIFHLVRELIRNLMREWLQVGF